MNRRLVLAFSLLLPLCVARAFQLTTGASVQSGFANFNGTDLATGSLVRIGTFDLTPAQITADASNLALLNLHWIELGTAVIGDGNPSGAAGGASDPANAGLFSHSYSGVNTTATGMNVAGSMLYYWVFNAPSTGSATQHGIFSSSLWTIPSGDGSVTDFSLLNTDINDLTNAGASLAGTAVLPVGFFGPGTNATGGGGDFRLTPIPEVADGALLAAACSLVFAAIRRRRKSI
ncbi:MAG TPA: hypothetical protein VHN11_19355 [Xanthobacteraceae bacterium]|jgi:hypothetical protein|nr:hypothetical protein [Xanthobacteraceae bacterium]